MGKTIYLSDKQINAIRDAMDQISDDLEAGYNPDILCPIIDALSEVRKKIRGYAIKEDTEDGGD